jgi:hypothetical protein
MMDNPHFLARDAFALIEQAEAIVEKAVFGARALTEAENALVETLKSRAAPMLARAIELKQAVALKTGR